MHDIPRLYLQIWPVNLGILDLTEQNNEPTVLERKSDSNQVLDNNIQERLQLVRYWPL